MAVSLVAGEGDKVLAHIRHDGFEVIIVKTVGRLVALALMPQQTLDVIVLWQAGQTIVYLAHEGLEQRTTSVAGRAGMGKERGVGTPIELVCAALTGGRDGCAAIGMLYDVERLTLLLRKEMIHHGIEAPAVLYAGFSHTGRVRGETACGGLEVAAAVTPVALVEGEV